MMLINIQGAARCRAVQNHLQAWKMAVLRFL